MSLVCLRLLKDRQGQVPLSLCSPIGAEVSGCCVVSSHVSSQPVCALECSEWTKHAAVALFIFSHSLSIEKSVDLTSHICANLIEHFFRKFAAKICRRLPRCHGDASSIMWNIYVWAGRFALCQYVEKRQQVNMM